MAQIKEIEDSFIDEVIKATVYNPEITDKTQGSKLRELFKLMRDQMSQSNQEINAQHSLLVVRIQNLESADYKYTPEPPIEGTVNDELNQFIFTPNRVYKELSDYEYTLDNGVTLMSLTRENGIILVGNIDIPIGYLKIRITGNENRNPSVWLTNLLAFTKK